MLRAKRSGYTPFMRFTASAASFALVVGSVLAAPLQARADSIRAAKASLDAANAAARYSAPKLKPRLIAPPKSLKENLKPLTAAQIVKLRIKSQSSSAIAESITLLDPVGHLIRQPPTVAEINRTARTFASGSKVANPQALISAYTHLIHGELLLAHGEQPGEAGAEFQAAARIASGSSRAAQAVRETANYDSTFALFYSGQYQPAADYLQHLLKSRHVFAAISRRDAALFLSHVRACAGYHAERAKKYGIIEPTRIAPLCGIEAIAAWLRANGRPYDKKTVLPTCRVTGEGSSLADLERAADKLGLHHYVFGADTEGLKALPGVLVGYVEHDHFVAITRADSTGVTYLCADCGLWPGGAQHVTWKQWRMMEAGPYMALATPGSDADEALKLASAAARRSKENSPKGAEAQRVDARAANRLHLASAEGQSVSAAAIMRLAARLEGHVMLTDPPTASVKCGGKVQGDECSKCVVCCAMDGFDSTFGASAGDPVNLATLEEQYEPGADLNVYNPIGPSVSFSRIYNSLRPAGTTYNSDDLGIGWAHNYSYLMYDPTTMPITRFQQGSTNTNISSQGTDAPGSGLVWDVVQNGITIASSSTTNGWSASNTGSEGQNINLTIPSGAATGHDYEVRTSGGVTFFSAFFDVYATTSNGQVPSGGSATFSFTGTDSPASGLNWDIVESGGTTIATSITPNGWALNTTGVINSDTVTAPATAAQTTYEVRYAHGGYYGTSHVSSYFQVYPIDYNPKTGTRYLIEPNGAQVAVTAYAIPSAATPTVTCVLPAGYPMIVTWNYLATNTCGYYNITFANRTQMVTSSSEAKMVGNGTAFLFPIGQIIDQSGNSIYLNYGATGTGGFPMLASITDSNGVSLVAFMRTAGTGNLTAISDRYGRSVYYGVGTFATANVPYGYTQSYQELDQVSQIVATGTGSPPNRYAYGYQDVANGEGSEEVPFLHTITVPSPTGTGNATSTINYATNGTCYVSSTVDANGNSHIYSATNLYTTLVTIEDSHSNVDYSYSVTFDSNMSETGRTNGINVYQVQSTYGDPNDPYRASEVTNANGNTSYSTWDEYGNCLTSTSARGTVTTYTMSYTNFVLGEVTQIAEGAKTPTTLSYYEPSGLIQTANVPAPGTASNGATVAYSWTYNGLGDVLTETGPGNTVTSTITSTLNYTTDGTYSQNAAIGQPLTQTDNLGHVTHMRFDGQANLLSVTDALGNETQQSVNIANQSVTTTYPATGSTGPGNATFTNSYLYAGGPRLSESQSNESGVQVWQVIDTLGAEGENLARSGSTEPYSATYDGLYRAVSVSDGNAHATQTFYSTAGYAWKAVYPNGDTIEYTSFDSIGDRLQRSDGRGVVTNYLYTDPESRLTNVQYPASTGINVAISYDQYGRTTGVTDGSGTHGYVLDDLGNMLIDTTTYTGLPALSLTSHYNPDGSRSSLSLPDGSTNSYQFDAAARPTGLTGAGGQSWGWSYLNNNWIAQQNAASQVITTPTYNAWGAVTNLSNNLNNIPQTLLSNYAVGFAANLTLGAVTANMPAAPSAFSGTTSYTHDAKIELTNETSGRGGGYNFTSAFDGAGNPTTFKGASNTFNSANQNTANGFDGNGNPTRYNGNALTFDAENRMTAYGSVMTAGYRADGLRAWKQNSTGTTYYLYDGDELIEEVNSSGSPISKMTWGPTGLLARTTSTRTLLYTTDDIGQVAQQVDASSGSIVASYLFDAWGARQVSTSDPTAASDPFSGYNTEAGYYTDWETGLQLLGHRYYDPSAGRFLNRDPIGMAGGVNVYGYCANGPLSSIDPSGHGWISIGIGIGVGVGIIVGGGPLIVGMIIGGLVATLISHFGEHECWGNAILDGGWAMGGIELLGPVALIGGGMIGSGGGGGAGEGGEIGGGGAVGGEVGGAGEGGGVGGTPSIKHFNDPTVPPADGFEWRGNGSPESGKGSWFNPGTGESLHPDLGHPEPIGPHWDWKDGDGDSWRILPGGIVLPK